VDTSKRSKKNRASEEKEHPSQQADQVPVAEAGPYKEQRGDGKQEPSPDLVPGASARAFSGHTYPSLRIETT
jgi:hypothetical protein